MTKLTATLTAVLVLISAPAEALHRYRGKKLRSAIY